MSQSSITSFDGGVMFDGPDAARIYYLAVIRKQLEFEIATGYKASNVSLVSLTNKVLGTNVRRKNQALSIINDEIGKALAAMRGDDDAA